MSGEVLIADSKPSRLAYALERFEHVKRIAFDPVPGGCAENTREPVDGGIDVGADQQAPELVVVSGVGDHREIPTWEHRLEFHGEHGPSGPPGQHDHPHRK